MTFDLKTAIGSIAPTLASMLGTPLAGVAVSALLGAMDIKPLTTPDKSIAAITDTIQAGKMTPDNLAALRAADQHHAEILGQQGIDLQKISDDYDLALTQTLAADTADARHAFSQQQSIFWLGVTVLGTFAASMCAVLFACYNLLSGGITIKDVATVAAISGMVGSVIGYVAANAQQVVSYFFGSSHSSAVKTDSINSAVSKMLDTKG